MRLANADHGRYLRLPDDAISRAIDIGKPTADMAYNIEDRRESGVGFLRNLADRFAGKRDYRCRLKSLCSVILLRSSTLPCRPEFFGPFRIGAIELLESSQRRSNS